MVILEILVGIALLILGRKLFWRFVSGTGFVCGVLFATQLLRGRPNWVVTLIALALGLLGAVLALFLQRLAIGIAGFLSGGYLAVSVVEMLGWEAGRFSWLSFVIGGVLCAALIRILFDWGLIILSSLTGTVGILQAIHPGPVPMALLFVLLLSLGIVTQASLLRRERASRAGS